ncbi:MAG TPA: alpha/beta hydrolase [Chitinophagaceae bacterium]|nr:alpha/beta hydrolase [Chitinophagaceae bacterium]
MRLLLIAAILVITVGAIAQTSPVKVNYGDNKAAGHYLHTRGFNMYYEIYGKGEPLLFIHGNGGSMSAFSNNIPYFAKKYMVIAVDSRAHGKSVDPSDSLTFEQMADDFNALLDSLHLDSCYVIGWSDGGINGLLLAIRHPDKVKKLAITGANLTPDTLGLIPSCYYGIVKTSEELRKKEQTPKVKNDLKINDLDLYQPHITPEQLHTIQCPTLVIGGDHDLIPVQHTVLIGQSIPKSYIWIIPNSGHPTPIDKKDQFNPMVAWFFESPFHMMSNR